MTTYTTDFDSMLDDLLDDNDDERYNSGEDTFTTPIRSFKLQQEAPKKDEEETFLELPAAEAVHHPLYQEALAGEEVSDEVKERVAAIKESRKLKPSKKPAQPHFRSDFFSKITAADEESFDKIISDYREELFIKGEKKAKGGRPKICTELEWRAVHALHVPYSFGYERISKILSNKPHSKADSLLTVMMLRKAGFTDEEVKLLLTRIFEGKSKLSSTQVRRFLEMEVFA